MNIGEAATASGVSVKMIRHYEAIGLIPPPARTSTGYRRYESADIARLQFVRRARAVGFDTKRIGKLLSLWQDRSRPAAEVRRLAQTHLAEIQERIAGMQRIAETLQHLTAHCTGDDRPECPILDALTQVDAEISHVPQPVRRRFR